MWVLAGGWGCAHMEVTWASVGCLSNEGMHMWHLSLGRALGSLLLLFLPLALLLEEAGCQCGVLLSVPCAFGGVCVMDPGRCTAGLLPGIWGESARHLLSPRWTQGGAVT